MSVSGTLKQKNEKESKRRESLAHYLYTMSQVVFGATFLSNLPNVIHNEYMDVDLWVFIGGVLLSVVFAVSAYKVQTY